MAKSSQTYVLLEGGFLVYIEANWAEAAGLIFVRPIHT